MLDFFKWAFPFSFSFAEGSAAAAAVEKEITGGEGDEGGKGDEGDEGGDDKGGKKDDKPAEDPEIDLGGDLGKVKLSDIQGWKQKDADYSTKLNDLTEKEKGLSDLANLSNFLSKNPKKLDKVLAILESPEDLGGEAGKDKGAVKVAEDLAGIMDKLGSDDPTSAALKALLGIVQGIQKEVKYFRDKETEFEHRENVTTIRKTLNESLDAEAEQFKFDEEEKALWKQLTLSILKDNPKDYDNDDAFKAAIKSAAKQSATAVMKVVDKTKKRYIKSKEGTPRVEGGEGSEGGEKTPTMENLDEVLQEELSALNKEK